MSVVGKETKAPRHILFFVSSMQEGGAERVAALLCNHWAECGHAVTLVPTFSGRGECLYPLDDRVRLEFLGDRVATTRKTPWSMARRLLAMRAIVREFQADVVVSFLTHVNVAAIIATRGLNVPVVAGERIFPPAMPLGLVLSQFRRWTYPLASCVVMQTHQGCEWLEQEIPKAKGAVISNPCMYPLPKAEPVLEPQDWHKPERRMLLAVGRLEKQKGFDILIRAFASLAEQFPVWDLVILGEGKERRILEEKRDALGLSARAHFPGRAGNVGDWYARADLFVLSSRFEGFPNTLLEAMAYGLPTVSFDCATGPADLIRDGVDGYLVPPEQGTEGLYRSMAVLMSDDAKREEMGSAATSVRDRFSPERVMTAWDEILGLRQED